jgi:hypothetical protein
VDSCAETERGVNGLVGAVVGDDVYFEELARIIELIDALKESPDHELLVVRGDKDREASAGGTLLQHLPRPAEAGGGQEKQVEG